MNICAKCKKITVDNFDYSCWNKVLKNLLNCGLGARFGLISWSRVRTVMGIWIANSQSQTTMLKTTNEKPLFCQFNQLFVLPFGSILLNRYSCANPPTIILLYTQYRKLCTLNRTMICDRSVDFLCLAIRRGLLVLKTWFAVAYLLFYNELKHVFLLLS